MIDPINYIRHRESCKQLRTI